MREPCACGRQRCHAALPSSALLPLLPSPPLELLALRPLAPIPWHPPVLALSSPMLLLLLFRPQALLQSPAPLLLLLLLLRLLMLVPL